MKLVDLEPRFIRYEERDGRVFVHNVESLDEAQGVRFLCPKCWQDNGGRVGTHGVMCWSRSRGTPEHAQPGPGRWKLDGTSLADLTLNGDDHKQPDGGARSVLLTGGCAWHGFITNGEISP